ncbi:hypothetical protein DXG03_004912 [Asterophora parasitica]|uniref:G-patch domain-containing protein n=1 Tax=Asterophora parasitica TaxID=117018 RepID=A0A9P7GJA0_9AGAR|nr:hypothetical protein DXG03_004912 [Asterophora parasitica]
MATFDPAFKPPPLPPPRFVPATLASSWDFRNPHASSSSTPSVASSTATNVSSWYRSLTSTSERANAGDLSTPQPYPTPRGATEPALPEYKPVEKKNKNNWFIMNAIQSDPIAQAARINASSPTLADIIARDPPPLASEGRFNPPVWLDIGPSNKGFAMLQRSGWSEGEPLGPDVIRHPATAPRTDMMSWGEEKKKKGMKEASVRQEPLEVSTGYDDVTQLRQVDFIDLTFSDSDGELLEELDNQDPHSRADSPGVRNEADLPLPASTVGTNGPNDSHGRTALLTPIATVLKSDRLGIGLKAKTVGPYNASRKRVTHNAAAMTAHVRAAEDSHRRRQQFGRGRRGFHVQKKQEERDRKRLLAYMND